MNIMTVTTDEKGVNNVWPKEIQPYVPEEYYQKYGTQTHNERAEIYNSRAAMLGIVSAVVSYVITGKLFFGVL
jgi:hypothetical protein